MNDAPQHYVQKSERRKEIAAAAREIIAERGFEGLRTRDIAERVGINVATLHYHVPSKVALIQLLAESLRDDFMAQHERHPRDGLSAIEKLKLEFSEFEETRRENPQLQAVYAELMIRAKRDAMVADVMRPMMNHWLGVITGLLREGMAEKSLRQNLDPEAAASMLVGALTWRSRAGWAIDTQPERLAAELLRSIENS